jgi:hypothetical protein
MFYREELWRIGKNLLAKKVAGLEGSQFLKVFPFFRQ